MESILRPNDLACLNESAAGALGAGLATAARAGLPMVRGFVITPLVLSEMLKGDAVFAALELHRHGAGNPADSWSDFRRVFTEARLPWAREMDILTAYEELGGTASVTVSTGLGPERFSLYACSGRDLLDAVMHAWLRWMKDNLDRLDAPALPALVVREIPDAEVSALVKRREHGQGFRLKAVFGLPQGLTDPRISGDIHELAPDGTVERSERRAQEFQFIMGEDGPVRVPVDVDFQTDEKLPGDMLASLGGILEAMRDSPRLDLVAVCFVSSRPVVYGAVLSPVEAGMRELPGREQSLSLLHPAAGQKAVPEQVRIPVTGTSLFLRVDTPEQVDALPATYAEGMLLGAGFLEAAGGQPGAVERAASAARERLRSNRLVIELRSLEPEKLAGWLEQAARAGLEPAVLLPGIRDLSELEDIISEVRSQAGQVPGRTGVWVRVMYPSNLFFLDALAGKCDVLALDLDSLGRLMVGGTHEDAAWLNFSARAIERALEQVLHSRQGDDAELAVLTTDIVSMPGLLEFLVRRGCGTLCVSQEEIQTVRHIIASVERRMLLEAGRKPDGP